MKAISKAAGKVMDILTKDWDSAGNSRKIDNTNGTGSKRYSSNSTGRDIEHNRRLDQCRDNAATMETGIYGG